MLSHPESPQGASFWVWLLGGGVGVGGGGVGGGVGGASCLHPEFPQGSPSGWL